ncbi:MAG: lipopolysaccharide kinase InaA family protein [Gemmatimonadaceae bacterium]
MSPLPIEVPAGYDRLVVGRATVIARLAAVEGFRRALAAAPTLHAWAGAEPDAAPFQGRVTAWGVTLPGSAVPVVVRHAHHGGAFGRLLGDRFRGGGRAPGELRWALHLREAGVRTPDLVGYVLYPAGLGTSRIDVVTRRLPDGADLPTLWRTASTETRERLLVAVAALLRDLRAGGIHHADLNAKNLHLACDGGRWHAWLLDVDRVQLGSPNAAGIGERNLARLERSLRKWRDRWQLPIDESTLAHLRTLVTADAT